MGFGFRKRVTICKGLSLNFGKNGMSLSAGPRGAKININSKGETRISSSIPGTGIYYRQKLNSSTNTSNSSCTKSIKETLDDYNFINDYVVDIGKNYRMFSYILVIAFIFSVGNAETYLLSLGCLIGFFYCRYKNYSFKKKMILKENENTLKNQEIRKEIKKIISCIDNLDLELEFKNYDEAKLLIDEIEQLSEKNKQYEINRFINFEKLSKCLAKYHLQVKEYKDALIYAYILLRNDMATKEIKLIAGECLKQLNSEMSISKFINFVEENSPTTIEEYIESL